MKQAILAAGPDYWLRDARVVRDGGLARVDIRIAHGVIAVVAPLGTAPANWSWDRLGTRSAAAR